MKKGLLIAIGVLVILVALIGWGMSAYNGMVTAEEQVDAQWGNVENVYQRRADLIPNLVSTVKGYATHESTTLENVIAARAKATSVTVDANNLNEATLKKYQAAQGELSQALGRLLAVSERYPDLKANQGFIDLQSQLEGTENRITVARNRYNEAAKHFNVTIRQFPDVIIAGIGGFDKKPYFEAEAGASSA
ncbi:MAG: LemA family protein, partial [Bacteroidales bacterium]